MRNNFYLRNANYYDRNAQSYEASSWYFFNKYKNDSVFKELQLCVKLLEGRKDLLVLEIGPGTGYLLNKLMRIYKGNIFYTCMEHSKVMAKILDERYNKSCISFKIINRTVNAESLKNIFKDTKFDFIMGSSILHHLMDYDQVVLSLSELLKDGGIMYFVREPIHKDECRKSTIISNVLNFAYNTINSLLMSEKIRNYLWPSKIKAEDASKIAYHMFKNGVSLDVFRKLSENNFSIQFTRKYNRRVSSFFSYVENKWLAFLRKDIFGNTLFSICIQKVDGLQIRREIEAMRHEKKKD
jgi:ubiquinone/menaquinone biosynthesis C-methylase UbiE